MTTMVKEIPLFKVFMSEQAPTAVAQVLMSGFIGQGTKVDQFEQKLRDRFGLDYIATTNSATSAEHLAWLLLKKPYDNSGWAGLQPGDEVLSPPFTCTATNFPTVLNGFKIKWVDIDPRTLNIDLDDLERKITAKTRAIMLVHWGGYPNDLNRIRQMQERTKQMLGFKPVVIEDCAHALGSKLHGKLIGTHGNISTFSLQAIKHVTAIDGGFMILPHRELFKRAKLLRWYGIDRETDRISLRCDGNIAEVGTKWHMNDVNATVGMANLDHADWIVSRHQENAKYYDEHLKDVAGVQLLEREPGFDSAFWIYSLLVEDRPNFHKWMKECGIFCNQVHERNDTHEALREFRSHLPVLDRHIQKITNIPVGWWVSAEDREYIVECIKKGW